MVPVAAAQMASIDSLPGPVPPHVLLKAGLRLTHFSYSPSGQAWRVVVPVSLGAEYRLAPRFSVYSQFEADLQASRAANGRRRQATAVPSTAVALGLRYYYNQPAKDKPLHNSSLYGNYLALEGNLERSEVTAAYVSRSRRQAPTSLTPGLYAFWGTQHRLRRSLLYDLNAGLGVQMPPYYSYESIVPAHYQVAAQVNIRVYWGRGF
ncbi:MAG: hypothetical protein EOO56_05250 [Hymenobacter sp.]|nr:MAG: hypothetical protein EOO56_05250 [Hymenobacter sp.]